MSVLKNIAIGLVVLVGALAVIGFFLPHEVHVERTTVVRAPPEKVFPFLNNFRQFNEWQPWAQRDPDTEYAFEGPEAGEGAKMMWKSNDPDVGSGMQEITESIENERVIVELDFGDMGTGTAQYSLTPVEGGTEVTWSFETDLGDNIVAKYMGLTFDQLIGADYEQGLASLKARVEAS